MSNLISVKANGSLNISVESKLLETIRKAHAWYTSKKFSVVALVFLVVIDVMGFLQITRLTFKTEIYEQIIVISAFAVAFEVAPLYIGYALCLKSYKLGRPIHNWVLWMSFTACVLGIIGNIIFRFLTMELAYAKPSTGQVVPSQVSPIGLPMTILMCLLPIITSLINLVIGCLSFDPLLYDLLRLSKKLRKLKLKKAQLEALITEVKEKESQKNLVLSDENLCYNNAKNQIAVLRTKLRTYICVRSVSGYIKKD